MKTTEFMSCPIARSAQLIGDEWVLLVLRALFRGPQRFDDLQKQTTAATNILTSRLKRLIDAGIVSKVPYQEHPPRFNYRLTKAGLGLFPLLIEMMRYGDEWLATPEPSALRLRHLDCGKITRAGQICSECGKPVTLKNVTMETLGGLPA
ncbi:winged helix-turn-helix transcriptional regulator [Undibacterium arcticum]|uniref:Winged helix-turn-helix transcriptional regulator n=1 Tax=Undibacterium arcticum TaxID=1762892 RepID=A0ABV7F1R4_9BURK